MNHKIIKEALETKNIRPEMFAVMIDRSISTVYNILAGRPVSRTTLKACSKALKIELAPKKVKTRKKPQIPSRNVSRARSHSLHQRVCA